MLATDACACRLLPQNLKRRFLRRWRQYISDVTTYKQKMRTALEFSDGRLLRECLYLLRRASQTHGARVRLFRRVMTAWSRAAKALKSLKLRQVATEKRMHTYHVNLVWRTWRRERHVQTVIGASRDGHTQWRRCRHSLIM